MYSSFIFKLIIQIELNCLVQTQLGFNSYLTKLKKYLIEHEIIYKYA